MYFSFEECYAVSTEIYEISAETRKTKNDRSSPLSATLVNRNDQIFFIAVVEISFVFFGILLIHILKTDVSFAYLMGVLLSLVGLFFGVQVLSLLKGYRQ